MPFKRPLPTREESSGYSSRSRSPEETPSKRAKVSSSAKVLPDVKLHIVQAKLASDDISELFALAERNCELLCPQADDADVIVTAITMRKRFERHVTWEIAVSSS